MYYESVVFEESTEIRFVLYKNTMIVSLQKKFTSYTTSLGQKHTQTIMLRT